MKYIPAISAAVAVLLPMHATAASVYPGCSVPSLKTGHHTFYVDPVNGSPTGDGSAAKPWRTLADVVDPANKLISTQGHAGTAFNKGTDTTLHAVNPDGPIKAGDLILLKSGDHGSPTITNMYNTDFITVAAAPGAVPVVGKTAIVSSAKWMFQGLTFQGMASTVTGADSVKTPSTVLVMTGVGDWEGPTSDIVFDSNTLQSAASTSGWTDFDWVNKPHLYAFRAAASCTNFTGNHVLNVSNGLVLTAEKVLTQGNTIEKFSNDAMDITASNLLIKNNVIKNGLNTHADPWHPDGIQGWSIVSNGITATNTNVTIDGNVITKTGDAALTAMQGISIFDGNWSNLVVQNNVVAVNHWNSITVFGAQNSKIINNTVVSSDPAGHPSWIQVQVAKDVTALNAVTVRNNIATQFVIGQGSTIFDHNIAATMITTSPSGTKTYTSSGTVGTANTILPAVLNGFMTLNTDAGLFDLRLRSTSVAIGFGAATDAPTLDILGKARTAPIDVGAYVH